MERSLCLCNVAPGQNAVVRKIVSQGGIRKRLYDIGLIEGTEVECVGNSPCGGLPAFLIRGTVYAIRAEECKNILIY